MSIAYAYAAEIVKSERDANGDLLVYGKVTGPDLDLDGQICDPTWLKSAMPAWMEWGNIREMHQPIAAGIGVELTAIGEDWWLKSKCVDPGTALKIEQGVLKGYSVGIKNAKVIKDAGAPNGRIVGGAVVETSYVDRPCNPTSKMTICKSAPAGGDMQPVEAPLVDVEALAAEVEQRAAAATAAEVAPAVEAEPVVEVAPDEPVLVGTTLPMDSTEASKSIGRDVLRRVRKLVPAVVTIDKAAPSEDVASASEAIACIARLIESEAATLAAGNLCDAYQIRTLLSAIESLQWFCEMEREEAMSSATSGVVVELAAALDVDTAKTPVAPVAPEQSTIAEIITKAVTEATVASEERVKALEATLAKVAGTPIPGGPVLARAQKSIAEAEGRSTALAKAAQYENRANELRGTDPATSAGYAELARAQRAAAHFAQ